MKPTLVALDDNPQDLESVRRELHKRYTNDYEIICEASATSALQRLDALRKAGNQVIIILAASRMASMTGIEFLERAEPLHPLARRVVLMPQGNRSASKGILEAISLGRVDGQITKPSYSPDERFHHFITELLKDWRSRQHVEARLVNIIGERWAPRSYQLRDLLELASLRYEIALLKGKSEEEALSQSTLFMHRRFEVLRNMLESQGLAWHGFEADIQQTVRHHPEE